ncbi:MAG: YidE/YbjL duplication [Clostridia bacterium]|nr:YidE/YbjL duplication [Clostridia bacterium]
MVNYLGEVCSKGLSVIFVVFAICALGYLLGRIEIKGISLGSAGVLLVALGFGVLCSFFPSFTIGETTINLFNDALKSSYTTVSSIGTALFVTAVGLIAGPKFFRTFNRKSLAYILMGVIVITAGAGVTILLLLLDKGMSPATAVGLLMGGLTSTPGLSAAQDVIDSADLSAGYAIAYLFGVLGVVLFVQIMPRLLHVDIAKERESFVAAGAITLKEDTKKRVSVDPLGFFPFMLAIGLGVLIGAIKIPGINFSLGTSGGTLVAGLIIGHFGHIGPIDCRIKKETLNFFRELGLILFLVGAGVKGGVEFIANFKPVYFLYGALMTLLPMLIGFLLGKFVFKLSIFNNLGSITGGMTSTPALGALINAAGTDDVSSAYVATYPIALVMVVLAAKIILMIPFG